jgi:hypothetical protein
MAGKISCSYPLIVVDKSYIQCVYGRVLRYRCSCFDNEEVGSEKS